MTATAMAPRRLRLVAAGDGTAQDRQATQPGCAQKGGTMKVAFATQDMKTVDAHFAGAKTLAIYDVSADAHRFVEAVQFTSTSRQDGVHGDDMDDRVTPRVEALAGCALLFVTAIGGPAAAQVVKARVHPIKVPQPESIEGLLDRVKTMLQGTPPPWLRKILKADVPSHPQAEGA